jgi:hypothetical protein
MQGLEDFGVREIPDEVDRCDLVERANFPTISWRLS